MEPEKTKETMGITIDIYIDPNFIIGKKEKNPTKESQFYKKSELCYCNCQCCDNSNFENNILKCKFFGDVDSDYICDLYRNEMPF